MTYCFSKMSIFKAVLLCFTIWFLAVATTQNQATIPKERLTINLRFLKAFPGQTFFEIKTGFLWSLAYLGAELPLGCYPKLVKQIERHRFEVNLYEAGFPNFALQPLAKILDSLKNTDEYARMCGIDVGRFVALTVHSPRHYYSISGAAPTFSEFQKRHGLTVENQLVFPVKNSNVTKGERVLKFKMTENPLEFAFFAEEGRGSFENGDFQASEFETLDVMPNGQLRFAVYDKNGNLLPGTSPEFGSAGKPGKCLWCHESALQNLFFGTPKIGEYLSPEDFSKTISRMQKNLKIFQKSRKSEIVFENEFDHAAHELLAQSFFEPSLERIAAEWEWPKHRVSPFLKGLKTHRNPEYPALDSVLFDRREIDRLMPFGVSPVPESAREISVFEPDFF